MCVYIYYITFIPYTYVCVRGTAKEGNFLSKLRFFIVVYVSYVINLPAPSSSKA